MPPLEIRQEFPTLKAFKEALHTWAIEAHFEPRILKSDTGRVRVGCKRDPHCKFIVRCNWERKNGREPLARVTVLHERHTCLDGLEWRGALVGAAPLRGQNEMNGGGGGPGQNINGIHTIIGGAQHQNPREALEIREDVDGNIVGGARVLGPLNPRGQNELPPVGVVPVLPKVQRNSASRLPFLLEMLPRVINITKETTPIEIRNCILREFSAEVHLQQCRRAKTEILKRKTTEERDDRPGSSESQGQGQGRQSMDVMDSESANNANQQLYGDMNGNGNLNGNVTPNESPHPNFQLHAATDAVSPVMPNRNSAALTAVGESPIRCPYCINHRWFRSIKDAVDHMGMHVVL